MNERQRRFVDSYLTHGEARRAAVEAGYSETRAHVTGSQLLRRPDVATAIRKRQAERSEQLGIDADWAVYQALEILELSKRGQPLTYRGSPIADPEHPGEHLREFNAAGALGALGLIIKVLGLGGATQVVEHEGEIVYTLHIDQPLRVVDRLSMRRAP